MTPLDLQTGTFVRGASVVPSESTVPPTAPCALYRFLTLLRTKQCSVLTRQNVVWHHLKAHFSKLCCSQFVQVSGSVAEPTRVLALR